MLPSEIEPFAQAHIKALEKIQSEMLQAIHESTTVPFDMVVDWEQQLQKTRHALYRFQVCMTDEHNQKERLHQAMLNCKLNHK